jgi:hypothetical protein
VDHEWSHQQILLRCPNRGGLFSNEILLCRFSEFCLLYILQADIRYVYSRKFSNPQIFVKLWTWRIHENFYSNKSPTRCKNFPVYYPDVYLQLNMFLAFSCPSSEAQWLQWPRTQHDYHHDTKVKPEAATAVIELLMMCGKRPETCWAVNKRQDNKLENFCIWLVIYFNCTMMHGLTNLKNK